ncbi:retinol dehydrogenase 13-like isoform X2 [Amphibalanus amphitrite]|nr:retinol dehydrogenase 13-like isoform X2 [Amphibalanus amphitrite]XP_043218089.1 retinol dehydrogenase 13-like isoform X2 [Amphibalanus amphitrite]XP_043218090.1 retinol dehydrogenase 13-like isoform X2 [Amphibalanus amphitrite]XP_043218091.1 retinol dehydrogenase 13-like isoform X2 [Amphibalanus amphitrite]XP_043218092.1 retinol dehydrogenase 13-like isoform X2 [Amphibalanus amphitrite]XP_043218093.1 retinol dehydrogenase 13-like isoform X2 [Amphibalanus amphitrite]XP_043218094.1 retinol 
MNSLMKKGLLAASVVGTVVGGTVLLRDAGTAPKFSTDARLDGRTVVVTGANTGIGRETALDCARRGARVLLACRDMTKCEEARKFIVLETSNKYVYCRHCDLASQESIRKFAEVFNKTEPRLDVLVNNAGVMRCPRLVTLEGIELQLGVNHMGHFLLTNLLLDKLKSSAPSRVVNLVSVAHRRGAIDFKDLNSDKEYSPVEAYNNSQLANMIFTVELARRLKGTGVTCNAVHPGLTATELSRHMSFYNSWLAAVVVKPLQWFVLRTPAQGATAVVYAAAEPSLSERTGEYISECEGTTIAEEALNERLGARLWATSARWTGLTAGPSRPAPAESAQTSTESTPTESASTESTPTESTSTDSTGAATDVPVDVTLAAATVTSVAS